jgi:hypothetical protein
MESMTLSPGYRSIVMQAMMDNLGSQEEPKVGIFWYNSSSDELFGVTKIEISELSFNSNGLKTVKTLHKNWWQKQRMRDEAKGNSLSVYISDYTKIPRGRIFQTKDGQFQIMCGSWMNDHIKDLVIDEFDLQGQDVVILVDKHWEIGHGWSEEDFI